MEYNKQFESNSHKHQEEKAEREAKKLDKIIKGGTVKRRKNAVKRFMDIFSMTDSAEVKTYVINDVLIPLVKNGLYELISSALQMKFFGQVKPTASGSNLNSLGSRINYAAFSSRPVQKPKPEQENTRSVFAYEEEGFDNKADALIVLDTLSEYCQQYGVVPVSSFYELLGKTTNNTDWAYGWTDLRNAQVVGNPKTGYFINFPKAKPIDRK